jgi:TPR repeat protein
MKRKKVSTSKSIFVLTLLMASLLIACSDQKPDGGVAKNKAVPEKKLTAVENVAKWKKEAEAGNAEAQQKLGRAYFLGEGVPKDAAQAVVWYRKAAEQENADAQFWLGRAYDGANDDNDLGIPKHDAKAMTWYRKAAEQGHAGAQIRLGEIYDSEFDFFFSGPSDSPNLFFGVPKDDVQAVAWYRKAAEKGNAVAQFNLGLAYAKGKGVSKDAVQAVTWFRKAAVQGNADAQYTLAGFYDAGDGVPKDDSKGTAWYMKAAQQGYAKAQSVIAARHLLGVSGLTRDYVRAYMWGNLAAAQGDKGAARTRDYASNYMTPEQIAEAQRLSREWKPGQHTAFTVVSSGTPSGELEKALTGTAFIVSKQGHLLTNRHIVGDCQQVRLAGSDKPLKALPQDEANDLALLQMTGKSKAVAVFRAANDLRQGESIAAYGYPLHGALAAGGNLSPGVVSALAGLGNNTSQIQITAPVQQGNSGGPVLDGKGQVVGVVVQKLDAVKVAKLTGDVPQNVNFAINESTTRAFLDSNQVQYKTGHWWNIGQKDLTEIAEDARTYTVVVECWK